MIFMSYDNFITAKKNFIAQFDGFKPRDNNGEEQHLQNLVDEYKEILVDLESSKGKVEDVLSLGDVDFKTSEKKKFYPNLMKMYHGIRAAVITGAVSSGATLGLFYLLGQGNPALWSSTFSAMCIGMSLPLATGIAAIPTVLGVKKFITARKNGREPNVKLIEKRVLKRARKNQRAFSTLALKAKSNLDAILTGTLSLHKEKKITTKKGSTKSVSVYNDGFEDLNNLPFFAKRKLNKTLNKYSDKLNRLTEIHGLLKLHTASVSEKRKEEKSLVPKREQIVQTSHAVAANAKVHVHPVEDNVKTVSKKTIVVPQKQKAATATLVAKKVNDDPRKPVVVNESKHRVHKGGTNSHNSNSSTNSGTRRG